MGTPAQLIFLLAQFSPTRGVSSLFRKHPHRRAQKCVSYDSKPSQTDKQVKDHWPCLWVEQGPIGGAPRLQEPVSAVQRCRLEGRGIHAFFPTRLPLYVRGHHRGQTF